MKKPISRRCLLPSAAAVLVVLIAARAFAWDPAGLVLPSGSVADAIRAAADESAKNPGDPELLARLGWWKHFYLNENEEAEKLLQEALRSRPDPVSLFALAQIHRLRGDRAESLRLCLEICRRFPEDPIALWASAELNNSVADYETVSAEAAPVLQELLSGRRLRNQVTARYLSQALLSIARNSDAPLKQEDVAFSGGYLTKWVVVGPFGKFDNLSYRESYPPEADSEIKKSYRSRSGVISPVSLRSPGGAVRVPDFLERVGAFYAVSILESPREQEVWIDIFSEAPHKLFLNGRPILESESFARFVPSERSVKTRLMRGRNCLMVKLCGGSGAQPFFFASVTNPESFLRADFQEVAGLALPIRLSGDRRTPRVAAVESEDSCYGFFREALGREPENPLVLYLLAMIEKGRENYAEARSMIEAAAKVNPDYAPLFLDTGDILLSSVSAEELNFERTMALAREAFERCLELAPDALEAKRGVAALEMVAGREVPGVRLLRECREKAPENPRILSALYQAYAELGWEPEAYEALKKLLSVLPADCRAATRAYGYFKEHGFFQELPPIERKLGACAKHRDLLVDIYLQSGRVKEAADLLLALAGEKPENLALRRTLFDLLLKLERFDEARKVLQEISDLSAGLDRVEEKAADLAFARGGESEGLALLEKAYERFPGDAELERSLFLLKGRHVFDPFILDGLKCIEEAPSEDAYSNSSSYMLLDQLLVRINRDGSGEYRVHEIARVLDKEGIEREGEVRIPAGAEIFALRTVKKDGTILEPETIPEKETVSMPGLQEGDFVEVAYSVHQSNLDEIPGGYNNDMVFAFQTANRPLHHSELVVYAPPDMHLNLFERNFSAKPEVRRIEGYEAKRWVVRESPAAVEEPDMGSDIESMPYIRVSYNVSWEDVAQYYENRIVEKLRPNRELQETVRRLSEGKRTDSEKVKSFLAFLKSAVARTESGLYNGRATEILADGAGSRFILLLAMLKEAGIPFTVLQTRLFPALDTDLESPNIHTFSAPLVSVTLREGGTAWVDPTLDFPVFNYFSGAYHGSDAIVVYPHRRDLFVKLPPSTEEEERMETDVTLDVGEDRSLGAEIRILFPGMTGDLLRNVFSSAKPEEKELFFENLASHDFPGASDIKGESANPIEETEKPFEIRIRCRAVDYLEPSGEIPLKTVGMSPLKLTTSYATLPERKFPLYLWPILSNVTDVAIRLPEGLTVGALPEEKHLTGEFGEYRLEVSEDSQRNQIRLRRTVVVPSQRIDPSRYPSFRAFCDAIAEIENQSVRTVRREPASPRQGS